MERKKLYRFGVAAMSLGLLVSACSSANDQSADQDDAAPGRTTLEVSYALEPPTLDPYQSGHGGMVNALSPMLLTIVQSNNEGELHSDSLESWEVSEDGRTVTLHVRDDIAWNDGTPMTSADVLMSLASYVDPSISAYAPQITGVAGVSEFVDGEADSISGLSAPDEHTVVVELDSPQPWLTKLSGTGGLVVLPEHILGDVPHDELGEHEYFQTFPVTNGPYRFVESVSGQHVEYERDPNWSQGEAPFERVFLKWVEQTVAPAQLETGEVQLIQGVDPADADRLSQLDGVELQTATGKSYQGWALMYHEPLLDQRVRQAMMYAIDREGICEEVFHGYCTVPTTNIPIPGPEWAIPTEDMIEYTYDPDKARELLDEAGWDPATELTLLQWGTDTPMHDIIQGNLADVGINFTIENVDIPTLFERTEQEPESLHAFNAASGNVAIDPSVVHGRFACGASPPAGENRSYYCNEELDQLFNAGLVETDPERRAEIYHDALRIINKEVPYIYTHFPDSIVAHDSRLKGVEVGGGSNTLWNIAEWTWEQTQ